MASKQAATQGPPRGTSRDGKPTPIALDFDRNTLRRVEKDWAFTPLERMLESWLAQACGRRSSGYIAIRGAGTGLWALSEQDTGLHHRLSAIKEVFDARFAELRGRKRRSGVSDRDPQLNDDRGKLWLRLFRVANLDRPPEDLRGYEGVVNGLIGMAEQERKVASRREPQLDLRAESLPPRPEEALNELEAHFRRFAGTYPEHVPVALKRLGLVGDEYRPLDTERVLGIRDAVEITSLSEQRIYQLAGEGRLGRKQGTRWLFSEAELHECKNEERKPGPRSRPTASPK